MELEAVTQNHLLLETENDPKRTPKEKPSEDGFSDSWWVLRDSNTQPKD